MKPEKRKRSSAAAASESKSKLQPSHTNETTAQNHSEHDQFLQAFEKPTQIYRFLKNRQTASPIFLQRTLSYMHGRSKRKANTRSVFRINSLLDKTELERAKQQLHCYKSDFLNITFTGFYSADFKDMKEANVDVYLVEVLHKKRKDSSNIQTTYLGSALVTANPVNHSLTTDTSHTFSGATSAGKNIISIAANKFHKNGNAGVLDVGSGYGNLSNISTDVEGAKSCVLVIKVTPSGKSSPSACEVGSLMDSGSTVASKKEVSPVRSSSTSDCENQQPPRKKLRSCRDSSVSRSSTDVKQQMEPAAYSVQLEVYDRHQRCLLSDATYVLEMVREGEGGEERVGEGVGRGRRRVRTWENVNTDTSTDKHITSLPVKDVFAKSTQLNFTLSWSKTPAPKSFPFPRETGTGITPALRPLTNTAGISLNDIKRASITKPHRKGLARADSTLSGRKQRVFYQFLFSSSTRQQTEVSEELRCPWCLLLCPRLHALLSHLRCCHARFNFTYIEHPKAARIDVQINDQYDGSYAGDPQNLTHAQLGLAFRRSEPVQRLPTTQLLVARPKLKRKRKFDLLEFQEPEVDGSKGRQVQGHNRLYFHSLTGQPIRAAEFDVDSEDELDPEWLRLKTQKMIEEFSDVNEGEKEIMKLWNLHVMKKGYIADCQMPGACADFIVEHGAEIVRHNLTRNLFLHLVNLADFGLIRADVVYRTSLQYLKLKKQIEENPILGNSTAGVSSSGKFSAGNSGAGNFAVGKPGDEPCCSKTLPDVCNDKVLEVRKKLSYVKRSAAESAGKETRTQTRTSSVEEDDGGSATFFIGDGKEQERGSDVGAEKSFPSTTDSRISKKVTGVGLLASNTGKLEETKNKNATGPEKGGSLPAPEKCTESFVSSDKKNKDRNIVTSSGKDRDSSVASEERNRNGSFAAPSLKDKSFATPDGKNSSLKDKSFTTPDGKNLSNAEKFSIVGSNEARNDLNISSGASSKTSYDLSKSSEESKQDNSSTEVEGNSLRNKNAGNQGNTAGNRESCVGMDGDKNVDPKNDLSKTPEAATPEKNSTTPLKERCTRSVRRYSTPVTSPSDSVEKERNGSVSGNTKEVAQSINQPGRRNSAATERNV